jgi:hypothetical protein
MITFHRDAPPAVTLPLCTLCRSGFTVLILGFVPGLFTRKLTNQALRHSVQKFDPWCMIGCRTILPTCPLGALVVASGAKLVDFSLRETSTFHQGPVGKARTK